MTYKNLISHAAKKDAASDNYTIDTGDILNRLLLFEKYTIHSIRLKEIPALVHRFGIEGTIQLLNSESLEIYLSPATTAQTGQATILKSREAKGALPLCSYSFSTVDTADRKDYIHRCFQESIDTINAPTKHLIKLKHAILEATKNAPAELNRNAEQQLKADLTNNHPSIKTAVHNRLKSEKITPSSEQDIEIKIIEIADEDYLSESNLQRKFGLSDEKTHKLIELALLDIAGLNRRISEMQSFNALSSFNYNDLPIFERKLEFLVAPHNPHTAEQRSQRALRALNLPNLNTTDRKINIPSFLELTKSEECLAFREWLKNIDSASDEDIREQLLSLSSKISTIAHTKPVEALRFITTNAIGAIPIAGSVLGPALSLLDNYIFNNLLKKSPIATFALRSYPSLFEGK